MEQLKEVHLQSYADLTRLAKRCNISEKEVVESILLNLTMGCAEPDLLTFIASKNVSLQNMKDQPTDMPKKSYDAILYTEEFLTCLPSRLTGVVNFMIECGAVDPQRAADNWVKVYNALMGSNTDQDGLDNPTLH